MIIIRGNVLSIEYRGRFGHEKKVVTLIPDHRQRIFIEFRGKYMDLLWRVKEGDEIIINCLIVGKISKASGIEYNNIVAVELEKI